jgi:hypothetical protein
MTNSLTISKSEEVARCLRIAKRYSEPIRKAKSIEIPGKLCDYALIASVFSAAAIETALNLYICLPIIFTTDTKARSYFGSFITKYARISIRRKLGFVRQFNQGLKDDPQLFKEVNRLFDDRNSTLHSTPFYYESMAKTFSQMKRVPSKKTRGYPVLFSKSVGTDEILDSVKHYKVATKFIELLDRSNSERFKSHANSA